MAITLRRFDYFEVLMSARFHSRKRYFSVVIGDQSGLPLISNKMYKQLEVAHVCHWVSGSWFWTSELTNGGKRVMFKAFSPFRSHVWKHLVYLGHMSLCSDQMAMLT